MDIKPLKDFQEHDNHTLNIDIEMEKFNAWRYAYLCQYCFSIDVIVITQFYFTSVIGWACSQAKFRC